MTISTVDDSASISTSEYSLPGDTASGVPTSQTDDCILQVWIDFANMIAGDQYRVRLYEKVNGSGATQRQAGEWILTGAQSPPVFVLPSMFLAHGWDVTVTRLAGSDRTIGWSLRKVT
jgi:hypothetical protein